jgi:hypothetical protein
MIPDKSFDDILNEKIEARVKELEAKLIEKIDGIKNEKIGIEQAMKFLNLKRSTIYNLNNLGRIPCKKEGKKLTFSTLELKKWNDSGRLSQ